MIGNPLKSEDAMFRVLVIALMVAIPVVLASLLFGRGIAGLVLLLGLVAVGAWFLKKL